MSTIEQMSVMEIINNVGLKLEEEDIKKIFDYNEEALKKIASLSQMMQAKENSLKFLSKVYNEKLTEVFSEYEDSVNKAYLVVLTMYNYQRELDEEDGNITKKRKKQIRARVARGIQILGRMDINVVKRVFDEQHEFIKRIEVINARELVRCIKSGRKVESLHRVSKEKKERLDEIEHSILFQNVVNVINFDDILSVVIGDEELGNEILNHISWNVVTTYAYDNPEIDLKSIDSTFDYDLDVDLMNEYGSLVAEALWANSKHIDIDKLLLISGLRVIDILENDYTDSLKINEVNDGVVEEKDKDESLALMKERVELLVARISKGTLVEKVEVMSGDEITYTSEDLQKDLQRFINGRYVKKAETEAIRLDLLQGRIKLKEIDEQLFKIIDLDGSDLIQLAILDEDNVIFLLQNDVLNIEAIYPILSLRDKCSEKLFNMLLEREMIDSSMIMQLYEEGIISIDIIRNIENKEVLDFDSIDTTIKALYLSISNQEKEISQDELQMFNKYVNLYKVLKIQGKTPEEINEASCNLIELFEEELNSDILQGMYQFGLIPLEIVADWGVDLTEMLSNNSIKPTDLQELYNKQVIKIESIKDVLVNGDLPYEEKLDLIYSTFDGESEEEYEIREELVQLLENGKGYKAENNKTEKGRKKGSGVKGREFITDPHARWKLISLLDKDYSKKFLPLGMEIIDGHRVFLLPNLGNVVIERMHENKRGKKVNAYGSATYIMSSENFFRNINDIIIDKAINRTALRELVENERATRIIHSTAWGNSVKRYFDINEENDRYSKEDIELIDVAIANVNRSRRERSET